MPRKWARACVQLLLSAAQDQGFVVPEVVHARRAHQPAHRRKRLMSEFGEIRCTTCAVSHLPGETITLENGVKAKLLEIVQGGSREEMKVK
eukprot:1483508-Amphidinium_carterae.1